MGIIQSRASTESLKQGIIETFKEISRKYVDMTSDEKCKDMEVFYHDRLINFKRSDLIEVAITVGYRSDKLNESKKEDICKQIISHFKERLLLVRNIEASINKCDQIIERVRSGEICTNAKQYIDKMNECKSVGGIWVNEGRYNELKRDLKAKKLYSKWKTYVNNIDDHYRTYLEKLKEVSGKLKYEVGSDIDTNKFSLYKVYIDKLLGDMIRICEIYYLLAINLS